MLNKVVALKKETSAPRQITGGDVGSRLVELFYSLNTELECNPSVYQTEDLWVYYPHSGYPCDSLMNGYGPLAAQISRFLRVSFCGSTEEQETGELLVSWPGNGDRVCYEKRDVSGRNFTQLSDLCVRLGSPDPALLTELGNCLRHLDYRSDFLAVRRTARTSGAFRNTEELSPDTYFRFLPLNDYAVPLDACTSLSLEQRQRLWLLLLCDGVSALEFEYVLAAWEQGRLTSLFSWELSLRMALDKSGVTVSYENGGFHMAGSGGRLVYDYATGTAAQKLLLKILFPAAPQRA